MFDEIFGQSHSNASMKTFRVESENSLLCLDTLMDCLRYSRHVFAFSRVVQCEMSGWMVKSDSLSIVTSFVTFTRFYVLSAKC